MLQTIQRVKREEGRDNENGTDEGVMKQERDAKGYKTRKRETEKEGWGEREGKINNEKSKRRKG